MDINYELIIFYAVIISGTVALCDMLFWAPKRKVAQQKNLLLLIDYARSLFPVLLIVFSARSFAFEPRRIPSGSLEPTLLVGDYVLVNKFTYGIRLPVIHKKILSLNEPKRGDIVVFREPPLEKRDLIKRVIGVPGDHITYHEKILYINGKAMHQQFVRFTTDQDEHAHTWKVMQKQENLSGITHGIYQIPEQQNDDFDVIVPEGNYFMMGDNRDDSADSRYWGFLPEENIIGKATRVLISFDTLTHPVRWERIASKIV